jgi:hypothetical protein
MDAKISRLIAPVLLLLLLNILGAHGSLVGAYIEPREDDPYTSSIEVNENDDAYAVLSKLEDDDVSTINGQ